MKFAGQFILSLAAVSAFATTAPAGDQSATATASDNPYSSIMERNVFALVPIPVASAASETPPPDPPLKITVNGVMHLFGKPEVLFKVTPKPAPGQPPKDLSYTMGEGERQDDITVTKIDDVTRTITFNNHGVVQELGLTDVKLTTPAGGAPGGPGGPGVAAGGIPMPAGAAPGASGGLIGRGIKGRGPAGATGTPNQNPGTATTDAASAEPASKGTIEDQVMKEAKNIAQIEQNRLDTQDLVDQGKMPPLPPTMLTPADATAADGSPLVVDPEPGTPPPGTPPTKPKKK